MKNQHISRRNFLKSPLQKKEEKRSQEKNTSMEGNKIKMLTADGKLVEVNSAALINQPNKTTKNQEILRWMEEVKKNQ